MLLLYVGGLTGGDGVESFALVLDVVSTGGLLALLPKDWCLFAVWWNMQ